MDISIDPIIKNIQDEFYFSKSLVLITRLSYVNKNLMYIFSPFIKYIYNISNKNRQLFYLDDNQVYLYYFFEKLKNSNLIYCKLWNPIFDKKNIFAISENSLNNLYIKISEKNNFLWTFSLNVFKIENSTKLILYINTNKNLDDLLKTWKKINKIKVYGPIIDMKISKTVLSVSENIKVSTIDYI